MKEMKKILSFLLALVMVVGLAPATAFAAEVEADFVGTEAGAVVDTAVFFSDLHTETYDAKTSLVKNIFGSIKNGVSVPVSAVFSVGDVRSTNETRYGADGAAISTVTDSIRAGLGDDAVNVYYAWSDHDRDCKGVESGIDDYTGLVYGAGADGTYGTADDDNYYVYFISMSDMSTYDRYDTGVFGLKQETLDQFTADVAALDHTKPLFICSHVPLHDNREDNGYAYQWYQVISEAAETMDIVFLHGHNHKYDAADEYYYAKGDKMMVASTETSGTKVVNGTTMADLVGKEVTLNFTHLCVGYMEPDSTGTQNSSVRQDTVMVASIREGSIELTTYDKNGVYTSKYAVDATVTRDHANTPSQLVVDGTNEYAVGDVFVMPTVSVKYSNGTSETVTDYTVTGAPEVDENGKLTAAGTYTLTYTCTVTVGDKEFSATAQFVVTVRDGATQPSDPEVTEPTVGVVVNGAAVEVEISDVTASQTVIDAMAAVENVTDFVAYDFDLTLNEGETATVSVPVPETWADGTLMAYHINADGQVDETVPAEYVDGKAVFTVSHFSTWVVGTGNLPDHPAYYKLVSGPEDGKEYLIVNRNSAGDGYAIGETDEVTVAKDGDDTVITDPGDAIVWKAAGSGSSWTFENSKNSGEYLGYTGRNPQYSLTTSADSATEWTWGNNNLHFAAASWYYYINYAQSGWSYAWSLSFDNRAPTTAHIYFYEKVDAVTGAAVEFTVNKDEVKLNKGDTETLIPTVTVAGQPDDSFTIVWSSSDDAVATVNENGVITAVEVGTTTITATLTHANGEELVEPISVTINVIVTDKNLESIEVTGNVTGCVHKDPDLSGVTVTATYDDTSKETIPNEDVTFTLGEIADGKREATATYEGKVTTFYVTIQEEEIVAAKLSQTEYFLVFGTVDPTFPGLSVIVTYDCGCTASFTEGLVVKGWDTGVKGEQDCTVEWDGRTFPLKVIVGDAEPVYTIDLVESDGQSIEKVISLENVKATSIYDLRALLTRNDVALELDKVPASYVSYQVRTGGSFQPVYGTLYWTVNDDTIISGIDADGTVHFTGKGGIVNVSVYYHGTDVTDPTKWISDTITLTVTDKKFYTPEDGSENFPEYPNPGSININKTATAVGNFSQTGIAQVELYGTGIPTPKPVDIILVLDRSSSMRQSVGNNMDRFEVTAEAAQSFVDILAKRDDEYTNNRIMIFDFYGGRPSAMDGGGNNATTHASQIGNITTDSGGALAFHTLSDADSTEAVKEAIEDVFTYQNSHYGTDYENALKTAWENVQRSKAENPDREVYVVFMSDGVPNVYRYGEEADDKFYDAQLVSSGTYQNTAWQEYGYVDEMFTINSNTVSRNEDYKYEYYSTLIKAAGVPVYTIGLGLENTNSAWNLTATQSQQATEILLNDIAGPANEEASKRDTGTATSKRDTYFYSVADSNAVEQLDDVFADIATNIKQAATDVTVYDQISSDYELIFDFPEIIKTLDADKNNTYSNPIPDQEFYVDVVNYDLDDNRNRTGAETILIRIYIDAATKKAYKKDANGDRVDYAPYDAETNPDGVTVTFNGDQVASIRCKYFTYNAATKSFSWVTDQFGDDHQIALRYFIYLTDSLEKMYDEDKQDSLPAQPYETNTIAWIEYRNHLDNLCRQEFPVPQLTWNGAQVTYYFYLVDQDGKPINRAGEEINFANAIEVTEHYSRHVVWNTDSNLGQDKLDVKLLAAEYLPDYYVLYDPEAYYEIQVYKDENGNDIYNYFKIDGSKPINGQDDGKDDIDYTTKVFLDKTSEKYDVPGTYTADGKNGSTKVYTGFDFSDTTVAFAVMFAPQLKEDVVVVDFGLDVVIDVIANDDASAAKSVELHGISATAPDYTMNTGFHYAKTDVLETDPITVKNCGITMEKDENGENIAIRVSQNNMLFDEPVKFYYDALVTITDADENNDIPANAGYMYSSVTVIPATTVYYEDSFVSFKSFTVTKNEDGTSTSTEDETSKWTTEGTTVTGVQAEDRPGTTEIAGVIDANNNYGFDQAYKEMSTYSMGSAAKITVNESTRGEATFTFYGTGFDVIGLTSDDTGTLIVQVFDETGTTVRATVVDTYYGMDDDGNVSSHNPDGTIWQVPVIKISGLEYGQYTAKITAGWNEFLDHTSADGYDLYLDAIRIYDPAGTNEEANDAYIKDNEGYPVYKELRDMILDKGSFGIDENGELTTPDGVLGGLVFIDCNDGTNEISDYTNHGPNNELYLAPGQAIAFNLNLTETAIDDLVDVQIGLKLANGGNVSYQVYNVLAGGNQYNTMPKNENDKGNAVKATATEMYYSIYDLRDGTIVIHNNGDSGILSVTNLKFTFKSEQTAEIAKETADGATVVEISGEAATNAVKSLSYVTPSTANFDPESMDIRFNRTSAQVGNNIIVTVTTSSDVKDLLVNGKIATNKTTSYLTGETVWSFTVPVEENGSLKVTVVGYDANGEYTVPYSESVTVVNMSGDQSDLLGKHIG